ncbi:chromatin modification- protein VID21 [Gnomoniopsis sp. IMI 355080]|nr:chromatin modification- protein VID21 [Gnomoniopsis sp. IMI 355080]
MTDVAPADALTLISSKKEKLRSIRTSRKRKLHVFFAVAKEADSIPRPVPIADDEQLTNPDESKFLQDNVVLQGPFLNERNLPARRLPPLNIPPPHDVGATSNKDASSTPSEKAQVNTINTTSTSLGSSLSRPGSSGEVRAASPSTLPITTPLPKSTVPPLRTDHGGPSSTLDIAQPSERPRPDDSLQNGSTAAQNPGEPERLQGPRDGQVGREVTFVEPQNDKETSGPVNGTAPVSTARQQQVGDRQQEADTDAMDIDETPGPTGEPSRLTSLRPVPVDASRPTDVLSSPGSTAQTATTPAVHDASPDTSPDNEGPQYPAEDDETVPRNTEKAELDVTEPDSRTPGALGKLDREIGTSQAASAQLLAESASAAIPSTNHAQNSPTSFSDSRVSMQSATQGRSNTEEKCSLANPETATVESPAGASVHLQAGQDDGPSTLRDPSSAGSVANLDSQASEVPKNQPIAGNTTPAAASPNDSAIQQEPQRTLSPQLSPSTPDRSADLGGSFSGFKEGRQAEAGSVLRKRTLAQRQGRDLKKAPIVVFEKVPKKADETIVASPNSGRPPRIPTDDYFVPLFLDGFARQSPWMKSPEQLLSNTHKTLSSPDCNIVLQENQACKVLRRIYHLQQHDKWSLRQFKRCPEPTRQPSHWDLLLQEMKWMRTDFREERKWKRTIARALAETCALWVASDDEDRKLLQVNANIPAPAERPLISDKAAPPSEADSLSTPMPDLVPSDAADSPMDIDDEPQDWNLGTVAPSAIFALQDDEVVFGLQRSAASEQLLSEVPLYNAPLKVPQWDATAPEFDPDASWRRPALPLSKYVEGEMVLKPAGPALRQSRYKYAIEDEEDDFEVAGGSGLDTTAKVPPENTDVALFRPEMKVIRDRLHSSHQFRPPTESLMPSQSFYENRTGSTWTTADDDELRRQVREYSYNWSLISKNISYNSLFVSAEERRTPWECFERWVNLEGFPNDVARTQYFRTYQNRIESAQRATAAANQSNTSANSRPQVDSNGVVVPPQRRRTTLPSRVDRRIPRRYFHIFDAMKKLAKKREQAAAKQQQTANNQNRRASENNQQKLPTKTPEDYSRLKHERERQMQEKLHRFNLQQEAQRQAAQAAALQGRAPNQMGRVPGAPGAAQVAQNAAAGQMGGMANPLAARLAGQGQVAGQARRMPLQQQQALQQQQQQALAAQMAAAGGLGPQVPINVPGMSQAQIAAMQAQARLQVPDANLVLQARRIQDQQRRQQLAQQQAQAVQAQAQVHQSQQQQGGQQQQQPQQHPPQHSPPQAQAQATPQNQQNHAMPNVSAAQANSPNMRNGINGINGNNFVMNNMAYAPNGMAMSTSPGGMGMNMQNLPAGSPPGGFTAQPRGLPPSMQGHFAEIENQIRSHNPEAPPGTIRQMALMRFQQVFRGQAPKTNVAQNAMDAAAGNASQQQVQANGIANASSPQQYAQMLRQQQQQQSGGQHAQQQALAQQAARQASQQHQRQPSGGATPVPNR